MTAVDCYKLKGIETTPFFFLIGLCVYVQSGRNTNHSTILIVIHYGLFFLLFSYIFIYSPLKFALNSLVVKKKVIHNRLILL